MTRLLVKLLFVVGLPYLGIVTFLTVQQRSLLYVPFGGPDHPAHVGLAGFRIERIEAADGLSIPIWRHDGIAGRPVVVYFQGNGGGLHGSADRLRRLAAAGFGVVGLAYRGYSGAPGEPSEQAIVADAVALIDRLVADGVAAERIVLYGWSLGSAVALQTAARRPVGALILEAPPSSILDRAAEVYFWIPVSLLLKDRWLSREVIGSIRRPILILHGTRDTVVQIRHGRRLAELAGPLAEFVEVEGGGHEDLDRHGAIERMIGFIEGLR